MISAKAIADSIAQGVRLTTLEVVMPRFILAEFNAHRAFSRNSASSRAIPVERRIRDIEADPFAPMAFGKNRKGMQAGEGLDEEANEAAASCWRFAMLKAIQEAKNLVTLGVHKQHANRFLEPFAWHTCVCTATEWDNFFALRISPMAQPEIRAVAEAMKVAMDESMPRKRQPGEWHLPYLNAKEEVESRMGGAIGTWVKISCARCARVSYLTHEGKRDPQADLDLYKRLASAGHMSPLEQACQVEPEGRPLTVLDYDYTDPSGQRMVERPRFIGNLRAPWISHRKQIPGEDVFKGGEGR